MKNLLRLLSLLVLSLTVLRAADDKVIAAVKAADDERIAATTSADKKRLDAIFSNDLSYGHSSAKIDTKASYIEMLVTKSTVYDTYKHITREFRQVAPGIVLMTGHAIIQTHTSTAKADNDLNYLAVWREENGKWRFVAWQSVKNPPATPEAPAAAKK